MNLRQSAKRRIRRFGASLPTPVKATIRRSLKRFSPGLAARLAPAQRPAQPAAFPVPSGALIDQAPGPGCDRYIPISAAGTTYTPVEASTFLQMEAAHLRNLHFRTRSKQATGDAATADAHGASALVDDYLQQQEEGHRAAPEDRVRHLVLVSDYPHASTEYGDGLVHRRIKHYQAAGTEVHVAVVGPNVERERFTYDGVRVITGQGAEARQLLQRVRYRSVSTHSLVPHLWDQIKESLEHHELYCFVYGAETHRWIRRLYDYRNQQAIGTAIAETLQRQSMWREVLSRPLGPCRFIFVSAWLRQVAQEDMEVTFPGARSETVHHMIDDRLFRYVPKDPEQRFRILWAGAATSLRSGTDLAVRVMAALRDTEFWDQLQFTIVGDGQQFGAFKSAFADDENVTIQQGSISPDDAAQLHRDHGIFLVPTRLESQGVFRDEAMASGLVPVTNRVAAVGEFVDDSCAVLCEPEDVDGMVAGILRLLENPEMFTVMSQATSERALRQSGPQATIQREMELLGLTAVSESMDTAGRTSR